MCDLPHHADQIETHENVLKAIEPPFQKEHDDTSLARYSGVYDIYGMVIIPTSIASRSRTAGGSSDRQVDVN